MSVQSVDLNAVLNFVNANDAQLKQVARADAYRKFATDPQRRRESNFATVLPVADSLLKGVATSGSLAAKGKAAAKSGVEWAIFLGAVALYNKAVNKITDTFPSLKEFGQENPVTALVGNAILGVAIGMSAINYTVKAGAAVLKKFPKASNKIKTLYEYAADESGIGRTLNNGMKSFAQRFPKVTDKIKFVSRWAIPVACVGFLGVLFYDLIKTSFKKDKNFDELKELQNQAAAIMVSRQSEQTPDTEEV